MKMLTYYYKDANKKTVVKDDIYRNRYKKSNV